MTNINLSQAEKVMLALNDLAKGTKATIRYEEIVVKVFKMYPADFHLKGFPEYPDSGDIVHKKLYDFRKKGFVQAGNKMFSLTDKGLVAAEQLRKAVKGHSVHETTRLSRDIDKEVTRISKTAGFALFIKDDKDNIVDTDLFEYLGATVRTVRSDFIGRLTTLEDVANAIKDKPEGLYQKINEYHHFMVDKFHSVIDYKREH
jgi:hypothetical protein